MHPDHAPTVSLYPDANWSQAVCAVDDPPEVKRRKLLDYFRELAIAPLIDQCIADGMFTMQQRENALDAAVAKAEAQGIFAVWAGALLKSR